MYTLKKRFSMGRVDRIGLPRPQSPPPRRPRAIHSGYDSRFIIQEIEKLEAERKAMESVDQKKRKAMDSETSNTVTSSGSYETMNNGITCALRAGDKESFIKRISNQGMIIQKLVDYQGNSILHIAAASGHVHIVEYIVSTFKDLLEEKNVGGETVLHVAARSGNLSVVEYLLKCTMACPLVSCKSKSGNGDTALHAALKGKHADVALYLLGVRHDVSFDKNDAQVSPLYLAVEAGYYEVVSKMLDCSCCPSNLASMLSGKSVVHAAIRAKRKDILGIVLSQDPKLVKLRSEGMTCLSLGASIGFYEGVCYILTNFDKPTSHLCYLADDNGFTPIHMAAKEGHLTIVKKFLKHCPDSIELLNHQCQHILHVAAASGKSKVVKYILELDKQKRMMNEQDDCGNTPLHLATQNWHPKVVNIFTWNDGVNLQTLNNYGFTALDLAEKLNTDDYLLRRRLTWKALVSAGAPNGPEPIPLNISRGRIQSECEYTEKFKDRVNTLLVIATLVATGCRFRHGCFGEGNSI